MKTIIFLGMTLLWCVYADAQTIPSASLPSGTQTIVCIRHAEKPKGGLGQLTCRGLNRALALPSVLLGRYGRPQFVFAPNPTQKVDGHDGYYYVRPIATIEPTAIVCGLPVNTQFGYREIKGLESELKKPKYQNSLVFIAWEHELLDDFAKIRNPNSGRKTFKKSPVIAMALDLTP